MIRRTLSHIVIVCGEYGTFRIDLRVNDEQGTFEEIDDLVRESVKLMLLFIDPGSPIVRSVFEIALRTPILYQPVQSNDIIV